MSNELELVTRERSCHILCLGKPCSIIPSSVFNIAEVNRKTEVVSLSCHSATYPNHDSDKEALVLIHDALQDIRTSMSDFGNCAYVGNPSE